MNHGVPAFAAGTREETLRDSDQGVVLEVSDEDPGTSAEDIPDIFERFC